MVMLAAKRAKQLRDGAPKLIDTSSTNPLTIALEEIAAGRVTFQVPDNDDLPTRHTPTELEALPGVESAQEEAAEITAEAPAPVDEAARVAELLKVPSAEEEPAEQVALEASSEEPQVELAPSEEEPAAPTEILPIPKEKPKRKKKQEIAKKE